MRRLPAALLSFSMLVCVKNAGRQESNKSNIRDRLKILKETEKKYISGKREKNEYTYTKWEKKMEHNEK